MEQKKTSFAKLKKCLTVSAALLLCGCSCFPTEKELDIRPKQIVKRLDICLQYKIVDFRELKFQYEKEVPLDECLKDGNFVLTDKEIVELRKAAKKADKCVQDLKNKCKVKKWPLN